MGDAGWPGGTAEQLLAALDVAFDGFSLLRAVRRGGTIVGFDVTYTNEVGAKLDEADSGELIAGRTARYAEVADTGATFLAEVVTPAGGLTFEVKASRVAPDVVALSYRDITERVRQERRIAAGEAATRAAATRIAALQSATAALARAVTVDDVYAVMSRHIQPLAGWDSLIVVLRQDEHLVVTHSSGVGEATVDDVREVGLRGDYPIAVVVRDRAPLFFPDLPTYLERYPDRAAATRTAGRDAWAFVPLLSAGRAIGAMAVGYHDPQPFDAAEREGLNSLGALYAQAIARAMLFEAQRSIATDLQHALLPAALPPVAGARHAVRYLPWTSGADVGGDWYDLIPLAEDTVGVVIGDVAGHSPSAAATMGQLRNALRAYALEGHSPTNVMDRLNRLLAHVEPDAMATCCYLELHPLEGTATVVLAGHLRPVLCVGRQARPLDVRLGLPLGVSPRTGYLDTTVVVPPGSALVLFTDGLVEDRRHPIGQGLRELCEALARGPHDDPVALVDRVLAADIGPQPRRDDVALLAITVDPTAGLRPVADQHPAGSRYVPTTRSARRRFQSDASNAAAARRFAADVLTAWGYGEQVDTARLLLGELITNAVQHTVGDVELRLRSLPGRLRVEVRDGSDRGPSPRPAGPESESGRGLQIVESLAESWGFEPQETGGKVVWFELTT